MIQIISNKMIKLFRLEHYSMSKINYQKVKVKHPTAESQDQQLPVESQRQQSISNSQGHQSTIGSQSELWTLKINHRLLTIVNHRKSK